MAQNASANLNRSLRWWRYLLLPFTVVIGVVVLSALVIMTPFAMIKGWRHERRATRKLRADGREIEIPEAMRRLESGGHELVAEIGKSVSAVWLVGPLPAEFDGFDVFPTYTLMMNEPRAALAARESIDESKVQALKPYLSSAVRIRGAPAQLETLIADPSREVKTLSVWGNLSPTSLLNESLD